MGNLLGVSWVVAGSVAVATVAIYLTLVVVVRAFGRRSVANLTMVDLGCVAAFGAVIGRTMLLARPTLLSGVIVLVTLFAVQGALRALRGDHVVGRWLNPAPVVLMDGTAMLTENLRRTRITADDLRQTLRLAGITQMADVHCVVLERNGAISVLRRAGELDPDLVADLPVPVTASSA